MTVWVWRCSIEARFPFLDNQLMKLAVNLPHRAKVRFSPFVFDWEHLFYRDKWIIRQIADRYLPADLSQRKKRGFPTSAFQRLRVRPRYFEDSFVADLFRLDRVRMHHLLSNASHALKLRLLHLNVWGKVCLAPSQNPMSSSNSRRTRRSSRRSRSKSATHCQPARPRVAAKCGAHRRLVARLS